MMEIRKTTKYIQQINKFRTYFNKRLDLRHLASEKVILPLDFTEDQMLKNDFHSKKKKQNSLTK
jgi:hypothetical protein